MKQKIISLTSYLFVLLLLVGCVDKQKQKEQEISQYRNQLKEEVCKLMVIPSLECTGLGSMDSVKYEHDSIFTFYFTVNEQFYILDAINRNVATAKKYAQSVFVDNMKFSPETKNFTDLLVKSNSWLKTVFVGGTTHKQAVIMLNPQEIKQASDNKVSESKYIRALKSQVYASNMQSPLRIDEITTLDSCGLSRNYLVYCYTLDDENLEMPTLESNSSYMKEGISKSIQTPQFSQIVKACIGCNKGIMYRYTGRNSRCKVKIVFSPEELNSIIGQCVSTY